MIKNLLLDKNIVIDLILDRPRKANILNELKKFENLYISTNTFVTCFYILRKAFLEKEEIFEYLNDFELIEIDKTDCNLAYNLAENVDDIEDCIELFTAKRNGGKLMTADYKMTTKYGNFFEIVQIK